MAEDPTDELKKVFEQLFGPGVAAEIVAGATDTHEAWDSVAQINLVLAVEQRFGITISPEEAGMTTSFEALREVVASKLG